jgi:S1-C subfamily serine protease
MDLTEFEPEPAALENLALPLQRAMKANVFIQGKAGWRGLGGTTVGSGVILRIEEGKAYVLTNRHVVDPKFSEDEASHATPRPGEAAVTVKLVGQPALPAAVLWIAPDGIDLALASVPVQSADAAAALWSGDKPLKIGDEVFAIGNPHGLGWTHTAGVVSQFRQQPVPGRGRPIRVIQTNAAINPGNSGGGLYDSDGRLVGITTWTRDKRVAEGLSFAIAFETLIALDPQFLKNAESGAAQQK